MSIFHWFGKKAPAPDAQPSQGFGPGPSDTTVPMHAAAPTRKPPAQGAEASAHRGERLERRELLYRVVRECMTAAGVLSSTYKFKVLSLDASGRKYLIMMDIPHSQAADPAGLADREAAIARSAKERFDLLVTAVYWRVNELVSAGARPAAGRRPPVPIETPPRTQLEQELLAFKQGSTTAASGGGIARAGDAGRVGRRHVQPEQDFSDTEPFDAASPLGPSQFGGLN